MADMSNLTKFNDNSYIITDKIEAIRLAEDGTTEIYTSNRMYYSNIPLETLKSLIDIELDVKKDIQRAVYINQPKPQVDLTKQYVAL